MKKILSTVLPSIIMATIICLSTGGKKIILGIYLLFPIIFIVQATLCAQSKKQLLIGFIITSLAFIVPINLLFHMGSCIGPLIIYIFLGGLSFCAKRNKVSIN